MFMSCNAPTLSYRGIFLSSRVTFTVQLSQTFHSLLLAIKQLYMSTWQLGALLKGTSSVDVEEIENVSLSVNYLRVTSLLL